MVEEDRRVKQAAYSRAYREANKEKIAAYNRSYAAANRDRRRAQQRKYKLGVSQEQFDVMLTAQNGACAICLTSEPGGKGAFHVDHCHATGKLRGLLCARCNVGLGFFRDDACSAITRLNLPYPRLTH